MWRSTPVISILISAQSFWFFFCMAAPNSTIVPMPANTHEVLTTIFFQLYFRISITPTILLPVAPMHQYRLHRPLRSVWVDDPPPMFSFVPYSELVCPLFSFSLAVIHWLHLPLAILLRDKWAGELLRRPYPGSLRTHQQDLLYG